MTHPPGFFSTRASAFLRALVLAAAAGLAGCANMYVDGTTKGVDVSEFKKPVAPQPAQVLFEFQTKGVANTRATDFLKQQVLEQVAGSHLFSATDTAPVPGGALLSVQVNNVPLTDSAFSKGFVTDLTFGLAGSQVSDGYICTVTYVHPGAEPVVERARHAIHTTMGAHDAPANATKAANSEDAVRTMMRQILSTALDALSKDTAFP